MEAVPEPMAVTAASMVGSMLSLVDTPAKRRVRAHVEAMLEVRSHGAPIDDGLVERLVRRNFATYARYWAEGATLPGLGPDALVSRMTIATGQDHLRRAKVEGRGVVLALPHIGSWEWGGSYLAHVDLAMVAVAERLEPAELFEFFVAKRRAIGLDIVPLGPDAGTQMTKVLRRGGVVGLLCDRDLQGGGHEVELLGRPATVPLGPATLALRTSSLLMAAAVYSGPGSQHTAVILDPLDTTRRGGMREDVQRITTELTAQLEGLILRAPDQWHVFQPTFTDGSDDGSDAKG